ncbi:GntR family transcriptional regulator [Falsirhodobacter deserti]|uniref:GntR family transcriptional regulator n=1 Tax=Falsirhodobacter deserti TaxID=1365611 RepID=UPI000FE42B9F|nr:GntR family transcriptional regulator [Falsirhodobacter deserti]
MTDQSPSLAQTVALRLREQVVAGVLLPGQRLSETRLAADLDISRNTLREVFRLLTQDGLLTHQPNRGVFVAQPSLATILDIYRVRLMVEVPALAQAWPRHPAVARMAEAVDRAAALAAMQDWRGVGSANMEFHAAIVGLSDSPRLIAFFARIMAELRLAFGLMHSPEQLHVPYIDRNRALLSVLHGDGPAAAADLLRDYLMQSEREVMAAFAARLD